MRILQLVSCRGWSSDAYWAARASRELERRGHEVTLVCRAGTEERVGRRVAEEGVERIETLRFVGGVRPRSDVRDVRELARRLGAVDAVHAHRGKEHWLAAVANRLAPTPRPLVRTRHIAHPVRPHAGNRWLYRHGTSLVVTVSEAIRRQYLASGLLDETHVVTLHGGADADRYRPGPPDGAVRRSLGAEPDDLLIGMIGGLRVMKGHRIVLEALARAGERLRAARLAVVGRGSAETAVREAIARSGLAPRVRLTGFVPDVAATMTALDLALYVPLESDGMSRVLFEYLAAGCAVVASRVGVVPEVLHDGGDACVVPAGDAAALAEVLARLAEDPPLRQRLGAGARAAAEARYSGARLAERLETLYGGLGAR